MSSVESYIAAIVFIAVAGFSCGHALRTLEMSNTKELGNAQPSSLSLLGSMTVPALFIYGIRWGLLVDGPHLIWVPTLIAWLITLSCGRNWAYHNRNVTRPWLLPFAGTALVTVGYHVLQEQLSK